MKNITYIITMLLVACSFTVPTQSVEAGNGRIEQNKKKKKSVSNYKTTAGDKYEKGRKRSKNDGWDGSGRNSLKDIFSFGGGGEDQTDEERAFYEQEAEERRQAEREAQEAAEERARQEREKWAERYRQCNRRKSQCAKDWDDMFNKLIILGMRPDGAAAAANYMAKPECNVFVNCEIYAPIY